MHFQLIAVQLIKLHRSDVSIARCPTIRCSNRRLSRCGLLSVWCCGWGSEPMLTVCLFDITFTNHISSYCFCFPGLASDKLKLLPRYCGLSISDRLVGGKYAQLFEYPWIALLQYDHDGEIEHGCSGTLINNRYVLTAAQCLANRTDFQLWVPVYCRMSLRLIVGIPYPHTGLTCAWVNWTKVSI